MLHLPAYYNHSIALTQLIRACLHLCRHFCYLPLMIDNNSIWYSLCCMVCHYDIEKMASHMGWHPGGNGDPGAVRQGVFKTYRKVTLSIFQEPVQFFSDGWWGERWGMCKFLITLYIPSPSFSPQKKQQRRNVFPALSLLFPGIYFGWIKIFQKSHSNHV